MVSQNESLQIAWFSCGVTSAVMSYLALKENPNTQVVFIATGSEHPDSLRFLHDCEKWLGVDILILRSPAFSNHWEVCEKYRYLNGAWGARCTLELKKAVRIGYESEVGCWDSQLFGFDSSERVRALRFLEQNPKCKAKFPLILEGLTKADCMQILLDNNIELPVMYRQGFHNNNCVGCVKGGKGYWALIRKCYPDVFAKMVSLEEKIQHTCIKDFALKDLPLDYPCTHPIVPSCNLWCDIEFYKPSDELK